MTPTRKALAASTALALMMGAAPAVAQQANACDNLLQRLESMPQELPENADWTIRDVEEAAESQDPQRCEVILTRVDETMQQGGQDQQAQQDGQTQQAQDSESMTAVATEQQRVTLQDEQVVEGIVRIDRQAPRVQVEEGETEVQVTPGQSSVSVEERAAQITVREQPARITLDIPQPTIRIEQAAPEIIITMPEPGVDVTEAEPQVEIRQAEPRVTVQQGSPTVDLELRLAENPEESEGVRIEDSDSGESFAMGEQRDLPPEDAEVSMTRAEPVIRMQQAQEGNRQVDITRAEPQVTYERAEPEVEMTQSGEVSVEYAESGEPNITFRRDGEETNNQSDGTMQQTEQAQSDDQSGSMQQTEQAQADSESGSMQQTEQAQADSESDTMQQTEQAQADMPNDLGISVDGFQTVGFDQMTAEDLTGMQVYSQQDGSIGDLDQVILSDDRMAIEQFVIDVGGFLGLGEHSVAVNPDEIQLMQGENGEMRVYVDMTEEQLSERPRYTE